MHKCKSSSVYIQSTIRVDSFCSCLSVMCCHIAFLDLDCLSQGVHSKNSESFVCIQSTISDNPWDLDDVDQRSIAMTHTDCAQNWQNWTNWMNITRTTTTGAREISSLWNSLQNMIAVNWKMWKEEVSNVIQSRVCGGGEVLWPNWAVIACGHCGESALHCVQKCTTSASCVCCACSYHLRIGVCALCIVHCVSTFAVD